MCCLACEPFRCKLLVHYSHKMTSGSTNVICPRFPTPWAPGAGISWLPGTRTPASRLRLGPSAYFLARITCPPGISCRRRLQCEYRLLSQPCGVLQRLANVLRLQVRIVGSNLRLLYHTFQPIDGIGPCCTKCLEPSRPAAFRTSSERSPSATASSDNSELIRSRTLRVALLPRMLTS